MWRRLHSPAALTLLAGDEQPTIGNFAGPHSPAALTPLARGEDEVVGHCRAPGSGCHHAHTCRMGHHVKVVWRRRAAVMAASCTWGLGKKDGSVPRRPLYHSNANYDLLPHGRGERTVDFVYSSVYLKLQSDGVLTGHGGWRWSWSRIGQSRC